MSGRTRGVGLNPPGDAPGWAPHHEAAGDTGPQAPPSLCQTPPGLHLALHPTQALGRLIPAAALPHSAPTLATPPSGAPSVEADLGLGHSPQLPHRVQHKGLLRTNQTFLLHYLKACR